MKLLTGNDQSRFERAMRLLATGPLLAAFLLFAYLFLVFAHIIGPWVDVLNGWMWGVVVGIAADMLIAMSVLRRSDAVLRQKDRELDEARSLLADAHAALLKAQS